MKIIAIIASLMLLALALSNDNPNHPFMHYGDVTVCIMILGLNILNLWNPKFWRDTKGDKSIVD